MKSITSAIEKAYADGYNAGYNDGLDSKTDEKPEDLDDNMEYVDLGLPSGTKWAAGYLRDKDGHLVWLPYEDAVKLSIPTVEQYEELVKYCRTTCLTGKRRQLTGANGKYVIYNCVIWLKGASQEFDNHIRFWLKDQNEEVSLERKISDICGETGFSPKKQFMGYRFPVVLVQ